MDQMDQDASSTAATRLRVVCFTTFVRNLEQQTARHRDVKSFLLALKGQPPSVSFRVPVGREVRELRSDNSNDSLDWFGEMVATYLKSKAIRPPFSLVPLPEPSSTLESDSGPWTSALALSISWQYFDGVDVLDILRFKNSFDPAVPHTVSDVYENLAVVHPPSRGASAPQILLIDHMFTDGRVMRASAERLREAGGKVMLGFAAGRTASVASHEAFRTVSGELRPFQPGLR